MQTSSEKHVPRKPVYLFKAQDWVFKKAGGLDVLSQSELSLAIPIQALIKSILASHSDNVSVLSRFGGEEHTFLATRGEIKSNGDFSPMTNKGRAFHFQITCNALPGLRLFIISNEQKARGLQVEGLSKHCYVVINNGAVPNPNLDEANTPVTLDKRFNPANETRSGQTVHTSTIFTDAQREKLKEKAAESQESKRTGLNM